MMHAPTHVVSSRRFQAGVGSLLAALTIVLAAGCGDGTYPVRGTVTFDGQPVPEGTISFVPDDPALAPDAGPIEDGRFNVFVKPGPKRVEIRASRPVQFPDPNDPDAAALREDYIPARYNSSTELTAEVTAGGGNEFTFDLHSGGAGP